MSIFQRRPTVSAVSSRSDYREKFSRNVRARYDAVQTTDENERHWANADGLSARSACSPEVRKKFRDRARYEVDNNSYAKGIVRTLANHTIGTGPRLQVSLDNPDVNQVIERKFRLWCNRIGLAEKLRTMRMSWCVDGESFGMLITNEGLLGEVKLDLQLVEADQIASPSLFMLTEQKQDGITFDRWGNPESYQKLRSHPGDNFVYTNVFEADNVPAANVIHLFNCDRPGQCRGIPQIGPALPLFAMKRRFTLATLAAAETAADFAAVMKTNSPAGNEAESLPEDQWFDAIPLEYRAMLTLPNGWDITQLKAEHPTTTYESFTRAIIEEIARCLNMPFNIAAGNSSGYNYSSGRLDHQTYFKSIEIDQATFELKVLDRLFLAWLDEAVLIPGYLPDGLGMLDEMPHQWFWDAIADIDPAKTANANQVNLQIGATTRARVYAEKGMDVDEEDAKAAQAYNVTVEEYRSAMFKTIFSGGMATIQPNDEDGKQQPQDTEKNAQQSA